MSTAHDYVALVRDVSDSICDCQLTHISRNPISLPEARRQHEVYVDALKRLAGIGTVEAIEAHHELPDAVFVEDTAVVLDECAILTNPGAPSRRPEVESTLRALHKYRRRMFRVVEPGFVDGGDVVVFRRHIFVGLSSRSNAAAVEQMQDFVREFGYTVEGISDLTKCLHLKSAITALSHDAVLFNPDWIDPSFARRAGASIAVAVDPTEPGAANAVRLPPATENNTQVPRVILAAEFPLTAARVRGAGIEVILVPAAELAKAEGAVTCCSLVFKKEQ
jgi:dimethylargininase